MVGSCFKGESGEGILTLKFLLALKFCASLALMYSYMLICVSARLRVNGCNDRLTTLVGSSPLLRITYSTDVPMLSGSFAAGL
jgi:hypothetical protein